MITRGYIIGKIIDDLTLLNMRIDTQNRQALFDLTKFTEDFVKEVLTITNHPSTIFHIQVSFEHDRPSK